MIVSDAWKSTPEIRHYFRNQRSATGGYDDLIGFDMHVVINDELVGTDKSSMPLEGGDVSQADAFLSAFVRNVLDSSHDPISDVRPMHGFKGRSNAKLRGNTELCRHIRCG